MDMKAHILAALGEIYEAWEALLAGLDAAQRERPLEPEALSVKDELAHLMAWQQRSNARLEAALGGHDPRMPAWAGVDPEDYDNTDMVNAWIFDTYHKQNWEQVYGAWRNGFRRLLAQSAQVPERELLDGSQYAWLEGFPLVNVLIATYDHHKEHIDKLEAWLGEHSESNA